AGGPGARSSPAPGPAGPPARAPDRRREKEAGSPERPAARLSRAGPDAAAGLSRQRARAPRRRKETAVSTEEDVRRIATALPETAERTSYVTPAYYVAVSIFDRLHEEPGVRDKRG